MNKYNFIVAAGFCLLLFGCFSGEDDFYDSIVRLSISDAVIFDNEENYVVGDTLVFELKFSRYLVEEGYSDLLDVFETSDSDEFGYSFGVSKFSEFSNNFESINIDSDLILGSRSDNYGYYGSGYSNANMAALLNAGQQEYTSKVGIILVESGRFKLDFETIYLSSGYDFDNIVVEIEHRLTDENPLVTEFVVGEN